MVFKLAISFIALAALTSAANVRRVACPDGKNTAINAAVSLILSCSATKVANIGL